MVGKPEVIQKRGVGEAPIASLPLSGLLAQNGFRLESNRNPSERTPVAVPPRSGFHNDSPGRRRKDADPDGVMHCPSVLKIT